MKRKASEDPEDRAPKVSKHSTNDEQPSSNGSEEDPDRSQNPNREDHRSEGEPTEEAENTHDNAHVEREAEASASSPATDEPVHKETEHPTPSNPKPSAAEVREKEKEENKSKTRQLLGQFQDVLFVQQCMDNEFDREITMTKFLTGVSSLCGLASRRDMLLNPYFKPIDFDWWLSMCYVRPSAEKAAKLKEDFEKSNAHLQQCKVELDAITSKRDKALIGIGEKTPEAKQKNREDAIQAEKEWSASRIAYAYAQKAYEDQFRVVRNEADGPLQTGRRDMVKKGWIAHSEPSEMENRADGGIATNAQGTASGEPPRHRSPQAQGSPAPSNDAQSQRPGNGPQGGRNEEDPFRSQVDPYQPYGRPVNGAQGDPDERPQSRERPSSKPRETSPEYPCPQTKFSEYTQGHMQQELDKAGRAWSEASVEFHAVRNSYYKQCEHFWNDEFKTGRRTKTEFDVEYYVVRNLANRKLAAAQRTWHDLCNTADQADVLTPEQRIQYFNDELYDWVSGEYNLEHDPTWLYNRAKILEWRNDAVQKGAIGEDSWHPQRSICDSEEAFSLADFETIERKATLHIGRRRELIDGHEKLQQNERQRLRRLGIPLRPEDDWDNSGLAWFQLWHGIG